MSIPIFTGLSRYSGIRKAKNNYRIAQEQNAAVEREIRGEIARNEMELQGYEKEYEQAERKVEAAQLASDASIARFNQGLVSAVDMQTTANDLMNAKAARLNAALQYEICARISDYYNGKKLY